MAYKIVAVPRQDETLDPILKKFYVCECKVVRLSMIGMRNSASITPQRPSVWRPRQNSNMDTTRNPFPLAYLAV
jgi:hypothetical protein